MNAKLLTRKQIAGTLGVTPTSVRNYEKAGKLNVFCHINGRPRYAEEDVKKLLTPKQ